MTWNCFFPIRPVAVQSGRMWKGRYVTSPKHRAYKDAIAKIAEANKPGRILDGRLACQLCFCFRFPANWPKKKTAGKIFLPCDTDINMDNLMKGFCDALQGIVYHDDLQVADLMFITKRYYMGGDGIMAMFTEVDESLANSQNEMCMTLAMHTLPENELRKIA